MKTSFYLFLYSHTSPALRARPAYQATTLAKTVWLRQRLYSGRYVNTLNSLRSSPVPTLRLVPVCWTPNRVISTTSLTSISNKQLRPLHNAKTKLLNTLIRWRVRWASLFLLEHYKYLFYLNPLLFYPAASLYPLTLKSKNLLHDRSNLTPWILYSSDKIYARFL